MDDASLDDFLSGDSKGEDGATADGSGDSDDPDSEPESGDASDVEPATTTARFVPDGQVCARCGETAGRCWESAEGLVCPSCKEW